MSVTLDRTHDIRLRNMIEVIIQTAFPHTNLSAVQISGPAIQERSDLLVAAALSLAQVAFEMNERPTVLDEAHRLLLRMNPAERRSLKKWINQEVAS